MNATETKQVNELKVAFSNTRPRPEFGEAVAALESFINEREVVKEETAWLVFNEAVSSRMKSRLAGPLKRRNYLNAAAEMLLGTMKMTSDPELLKKIGQEAITVADLLKREFDLEKAAVEEQQTRMLSMLMGTYSQHRKAINVEGDGPAISAEGNGGLAINPEGN